MLRFEDITPELYSNIFSGRSYNKNEASNKEIDEIPELLILTLSSLYLLLMA